MSKLYYRKESENRAFKITKIFDLAGRVILYGHVISGKVSAGLTSTINGKPYIIERVEVRNQKIDYLLEGEEGDLIIKGQKAAKIQEEDFNVGQVLTF